MDGIQNMEKTIGILTFEQFHRRENIGSSRIRADWPIKYWPEAERFVMGKKYEIIIFQKVYWLEYMEKFKGIKILDICDADFLHWGYRISQCLEQCNAVTTSTMPLAKYMLRLVSALGLDIPVWCIPDRLDIETFGNLKKEHKGEAKIAAWYGYSENFPMLESAIGALPSVGIEELVVIASRKAPFKLPASMEKKIRLVNCPWTPETYNRDILKADVIINPQFTTGRWKYKSNNKTINAWALGMPVAKTKNELESFVSEQSRTIEGKLRYEQVRREFDVKDSVKEYQNLISELKQKKDGRVISPHQEAVHAAAEIG